FCWRGVRCFDLWHHQRCDRAPAVWICLSRIAGIALCSCCVRHAACSSIFSDRANASGIFADDRHRRFDLWCLFHIGMPPNAWPLDAAVALAAWRSVVKVLLLSSEFTPRVGGIGTYVLEMAH